MCGIAGIIGALRSEDYNKVESSLFESRHRGPDETAVISGDKFVVGHNRLAIIDIAGGAQPMAYLHYLIVFNGEIYNFKSIRVELELKGYAFNTSSDTEVIMAAYDYWGTDAVSRLAGMYAFVIIDKLKDEWFMARDRMGQKPLVALKVNDRIIFSSEISSFGQNNISFNETLQSEFKEQGFITQPSSFYEGYLGCAPGEFLKGSLNGLDYTRHTYWCPIEVFKTNNVKGLGIKNVLQKVVEEHLISDVSVGLLLSGGRDSGYLAKAIRRLTEDIYFITIGDKESFDVKNAIKLVKRLKYQDRHIIISLDRLERPSYYLKKISSSSNFPFSDIATVLSMSVASVLNKREIKVALTGDGADEVFMGYKRYRILFWAYKARRLKQFLVYFRYFSRINSLIGLIENPHKWIYGSNGFNDSFNSNGFIIPEEIENLNTDWAKKAQLFDLKYRVPYYYCQKSDVAASLNSIEYRAPFLDHRLVEIGITSSTNRLMPFGFGKLFLGFGGILRKKHGFESTYPTEFSESLTNLIGFLESDLSIPSKWNLAMLRKWQ